MAKICPQAIIGSQVNETWDSRGCFLISNPFLGKKGNFYKSSVWSLKGGALLKTVFISLVSVSLSSFIVQKNNKETCYHCIAWTKKRVKDKFECATHVYWKRAERPSYQVDLFRNSHVPTLAKMPSKASSFRMMKKRGAACTLTKWFMARVAKNGRIFLKLQVVCSLRAQRKKKVFSLMLKEGGGGNIWSWALK